MLLLCWHALASQLLQRKYQKQQEKTARKTLKKNSKKNAIAALKRTVPARPRGVCASWWAHYLEWAGWRTGRVVAKAKLFEFLRPGLSRRRGGCIQLWKSTAPAHRKIRIAQLLHMRETSTSQSMLATRPPKSLVNDSKRQKQARLSLGQSNFCKLLLFTTQESSRIVCIWMCYTRVITYLILLTFGLKWLKLWHLRVNIG